MAHACRLARIACDATEADEVEKRGRGLKLETPPRFRRTCEDRHKSKSNTETDGKDDGQRLPRDRFGFYFLFFRTRTIKKNNNIQQQQKTNKNGIDKVSLSP